MSRRCTSKLIHGPALDKSQRVPIDVQPVAKLAGHMRWHIGVQRINIIARQRDVFFGQRHIA